MATPVKQAEAAKAELTPEKKELLASLERSFQQAARGETRPVREFLEEWRLEREAKDNARRNSA